MFGGTRVVVTPHGTSRRVQFRFPRSKSKRIRKKFSKRAENFKTEYLNFISRDPRTGQEFIVIHPAVERSLRQAR